jgi:hypothetical protein
MKRKKDILALLKHCENNFLIIEREYNKSLGSKNITADLRIEIKNFINNIRSILDYLACDIRERHCPDQNPDDKFYFPIYIEKEKFRPYISKKYAGLEKSANDLFNYLEDLQPFNNKNFKWLHQLNEINNQNKHNKLVEQVRVESKQVTVSSNSGGGNVSWNPNGVFFGSGVSVMGVPINPATQLPVTNQTTTTKIITWVDFKFEDSDISALILLKQSLRGTQEIFNSIESWL